MQCNDKILWSRHFDCSHRSMYRLYDSDTLLLNVESSSNQRIKKEVLGTDYHTYPLPLPTHSLPTSTASGPMVLHPSYQNHYWTHQFVPSAEAENTMACHLKRVCQWPCPVPPKEGNYEDHLFASQLDELAIYLVPLRLRGRTQSLTLGRTLGPAHHSVPSAEAEGAKKDGLAEALTHLS